MNNVINLWAVIVSASVAFALGYLWFTIIFREPYLKGLDKTQEQLDQGPNMLSASILQLTGNFAMAYVLALLMVYSGKETIADGMKLGLLIWAGFIAAVIGPMYAYQAFSLRFFLITAGYPLAGLLVMGGILGGWR